jgi:hypothetical protein
MQALRAGIMRELEGHNDALFVRLTFAICLRINMLVLVCVRVCTCAVSDRS